MKWSSSSSSLSSAGERRNSIFYTEPEPEQSSSNNDELTSNPFTSLESTILAPTFTANQEKLLTNTTTTNTILNSKNLTLSSLKRKKSLKSNMSSKRNENHNLDDIESSMDLTKSKQNDQLSKILTTLLYFESRLKNDQKNIRQFLYEKDEIINRQWNEIISMKRKLNDTSEIETKIDEVAQFCPKCRKNYYLIENKECGIQTIDDKLQFRDRKTSPSQSIEFVSSSEEPEGQTLPFNSNTFASARRSKKYMSKRTSGTFREYLKNRQNFSSDPASSDHTEDVDYTDMHKTSSGTAENNQTNQTTDSDVSYEVSYSKTMLNLHGVKTDPTEGSVKLDRSQKTTGKPPQPTKPREKNVQKFNDDFNVTENGFEITDDWYASASDVEDSDNTLAKPYGYNAVNPVLECVNQILLQQSMDGMLDNSPGGGNDSQYEHVQKNQTLPRAKRVHFSTQNSMVQVPRNKSPPPPPSSSAYISIQSNENGNGGNNVSNLNAADVKNPTYDIQSIYSNEYEPIGSHNSSNYYIDMESKTSNEENVKKKPIKLNRSNTPPDLPPKPPNLMKFKKSTKYMIVPQQTKNSMSNSSNLSEPDYCSISEINEMVTTTVQTVEAQVHKSCDYYSSAGNDDDDHHHDLAASNAYDVMVDVKKDVKEFYEESFSDIPKLPNVAEIISPTKKESMIRFINHDNYITKSPPKDVVNEHDQHSLAEKEINLNTLPHHHHHHHNHHQNHHYNHSSVENKSTKSIVGESIAIKKPIPPPKLVRMSTKIETHEKVVNIAEDKIQLQAEFDWYNLDAEYGKSNQPDVIQIRENESNENELFMKLFENCSDTSSNHHNSNNIENYNLDEEFHIHNSQPDIINNNSGGGNQTNPVDSNSMNYTKSLTRNFEKNVNKFFNPMNGETPKLCRRNSDTNYEAFLSESGLSSKPIIPRRKRVYYSGPFV